MHDRNKQMSTGEIKRKLARKKQRHRIHNKKKLRRESIYSQNDSTNTMSFETHKRPHEIGR